MTNSKPGTFMSTVMPGEVSAWTRSMAWASLLANGLLIVTGGAVRLTASGLGCPTWPRCTPGSWTNTPEMGLHGVIEFGNRTLTFVLVAIAILTALSLWRTRRTHSDLFAMAITLGLGIIAQAVIGGITVRTGLNPWVVGIHFVISAVLVAIAAVLVARTRRVSLAQSQHADRPGQIVGGARLGARSIAVLIALSAAVTIYLGTLVTGTGPHSGDAGEIARHTFDPYVIARLHAVPAYLLLAATIVGLVRAVRGQWPQVVVRLLGLLTGVIVAQGVIGYYQWFNGVPILPVALHLAGAAVLTAVATFTVERIWVVSSTPVATGPVDEPWNTLSRTS